MIIGVNLPLFVQLNDKGETELVTRIDNEGIILLISAKAQHGKDTFADAFIKDFLLTQDPFEGLRLEDP